MKVQRPALLAVICLIFVLLATANSGGYRYGIGDQAFYEPATQLRLHPDLFPRDRDLLESQAKLTAVDEVLAGASRATGLTVQSMFLFLYVVSLIVLCLAAEQLARLLGFSSWATAAFLGLLTLRHRIAKTGANTLEGYMHPRQLAFAIALLAFVYSMKNRWGWTLGLWIVAAALHPTTACWFAALIAGGMLFDQWARDRTTPAVVALSCVTLAGVLVSPRLFALLPWSIPTSLTPYFMDRDWMTVFADKDYIFISQWPAFAWLFNLAYAPLICWIFRRRAQAGVTSPTEGRIVAGTLTLLAIFAVSTFFSEARLALAVQLQVSRVFWLMDILAAGYIAWWLTTDPAVIRVGGRWVPTMAVAAIAVLCVGRGIYTLGEGGPDRALFRLSLPDDDWSRAMGWLRTQPSNWLILADPDHAWKYGTSVRVAASRDVVLEAVKDSAISLYDRHVAMRVFERTQSLGSFGSMSVEDARALGRQYGAAVLVTEATQTLALPRLYTNPGFTVYDLR